MVVDTSSHVYIYIIRIYNYYVCNYILPPLSAVYDEIKSSQKSVISHNN